MEAVTIGPIPIEMIEPIWLANIICICRNPPWKSSGETPTGKMTPITKKRNRITEVQANFSLKGMCFFGSLTSGMYLINGRTKSNLNINPPKQVMY